MQNLRTSSRRYKDAVYDQFARIGKALSSPKRLELLDVLCQGERTVEVLAREVGLSVANASHHLQVLRGVGLLETERDGHFVIYRLPNSQVCDFLTGFRALAEAQLSEVECLTRDFLAGRPELEPVDAQELRERVRDGLVTVLDVRPAEEYRAGHLPGAISVPLNELEQRLAEIPPGRTVVAYCRGPYCVLAVKAVEVLRARGFEAVRMVEGVPDWRVRGLPVAVGEEPG